MKYFFGPEMFWMCLFTCTVLITKYQIFPVKSIDVMALNSWYFVPMMVLLTFSLYWMPFAGKSILLLRIWIVCLIFSHLILNHLTSAYSQPGPGIGTTYMAGMLFTFIALIFGSIVKIVLFLSK